MRTAIDALRSGLSLNSLQKDKQMFERIVAFRLSSVSRVAGEPDIVLHSSPTLTASVVMDVDGQLQAADRDAAFKLNALKSLFHGSSPSLAESLETVRQDRAKLLGASACFVVRLRGQALVDLTRVDKTPDGLSFGIDLLDKDAIRSATEKLLQGVTAGLLVSLPTVDLELLADAIYAVEESEGHETVIHSVNPRASAVLTGSRPLSPDQISSLEAAIGTALSRTLPTSFRLATEAANPRTDRLRRFLAAWTALEVLVHKTFQAHETLLSTPPPADPKDLLRPMGRYKLITNHFIPAAATAAQANFKAVKDVRDSLVHGEPVDDRALPLDETRNLFGDLLEIALR